MYHRALAPSGITCVSLSKYKGNSEKGTHAQKKLADQVQDGNALTPLAAETPEVNRKEEIRQAACWTRAAVDANTYVSCSLFPVRSVAFLALAPRDRHTVAVLQHAGRAQPAGADSLRATILSMLMGCRYITPAASRLEAKGLETIRK